MNKITFILITVLSIHIHFKRLTVIHRLRKKMYLVETLIILQAISVSLSFDIQMEGVIRLKEGFLDSLIKHPNETGAAIRNFEPPNKILQKKFPRSFIMRANSVGMNRSSDFMAFVDHIKSDGVMTLNAIAKQIFKGMKIQKNFTQQIETVTETYKRSIQKYLEYIISQKTKFTIDEELIFLDMVETSSRLLYREQKKILNFAIAAAKLIDNIHTIQKLTNQSFAKGDSKLNNTKVYRDDSLQKMNQIIYMQGVKTKKEALRFICNKYEICRPYPAFTDYLADFIAEILKLSDKKLEKFVKLLKILVITNEKFFAGIVESDDKQKLIIPQVSKLLNNLNGLQETFLLVRGLLTQRFKIINSPNLKLKLRTQAVRILLDIINQAFQYENDDLLAIEFDTVVKNIRNWNSGLTHFPESSVMSLINNILSILDYNLSINAKNEVKVLIETLLKGTSRNEELFRILFSHGSKYIRGEDMIHGLQIM